MIKSKSAYFYRAIIILSLILLQYFAPPPVNARTIALVYDDSGSMINNDRFVFANYASQTLIGLLRDTDTFKAVTMSDRWTVHTFRLADPASRKESIEHVRSGWQKLVDKTPTPYQAVKTAMEAILKSGRSSPATALGQKQDWLIITTDGEIQCKGLSQDDIARDLQDFINASSQQGRTVRIIFILIGKQVNKVFSRIWQRTAPAYVEKIFQVTPDRLATTMETVAALITGRDQKPLNFSFHNKSISFTSPFPLARITLFQQTATKKHAHITTITNKRQKLPFKQSFFSIVSTHGPKTGMKEGTFRASVSHATAEQGTVLPAGTYTLNCDRQPVKSTTKVFIDAAVDFTVDLLDAKGTILSGQANMLERCRGEKLTLRINFYNPLSGQPLIIDEQTASRMTVAAMIDQQTVPFRYDPSTHRFAGATITVQKGRQFISCQARSPAYFNLKSKIFTIDGRICERPWEAEISPAAVDVSYVDSEDPVPLGGFDTPPDLRFRYQGKETPEVIKDCRLTAVNLPAGIQLEIAGQPLTAAGNEATLPEISSGTSLPWSISRTREFSPRQETKVQLQLTAADPTIKWNRPLELTIKPGRRSITIESVDPAWHVPVTRLGHTHPYGIRISADGRPLGPGELSRWHFTAEPDRRLKCELVPAAAAGRTLDLVPCQYLIFPCFTSMGEQRIRFRAQGPCPGDQAEQELLLKVDNVPWWERYFSFLLSLFLFLLAIWYVNGLIKKPRFPKRSRITVKTMVNGRPLGRERTHLPASPWFKRYLVPYIPEQQTIKGITFISRAGGRGINLYKLKDRQKKRISLDATPLADNSNKIIPWSSGSTLYLRAEGNRTYEMSYTSHP